MATTLPSPVCQSPLQVTAACNTHTTCLQDYLCNKLYAMPEPEVERYLLQFVYLAVSRPGSALERTIVAFCSKSFTIAIKVLLTLDATDESDVGCSSYLPSYLAECQATLQHVMHIRHILVMAHKLSASLLSDRLSSPGR